MNKTLTSLLALSFGLAMTACASTYDPAESLEEAKAEAAMEKATDEPAALEVIEEVEDMEVETEEVVDEFVEEDDEPVYK